MSEQWAVEVNVKNVTYRVKSAFTKKHFLTTWPLGGPKKLYTCILQCILYSVLHLAVHRGLARLVTALLWAGAEPNHLTMLLAIWQTFYY